MSKTKAATPDTFRKIFKFFNANVMHADCGEQCAPLNGGVPVCCDTENAIPVMQKAEWKHLRTRSKMWRKYKPDNAHAQKVVDELADSCKAAECRGAHRCERDNRSLACRTFPFFPYFTKDGKILGLAHYWSFEDRCWVISNMGGVTQDFVDEFIKAYKILFKADAEERQVFVDYSANMRRVFSRKKRPIYVIGRNLECYRIAPKGGGMEVLGADAFPSFEPFDSEASYKQAVKDSQA